MNLVYDKVFADHRKVIGQVPCIVVPKGSSLETYEEISGFKPSSIPNKYPASSAFKIDVCVKGKRGIFKNRFGTCLTKTKVHPQIYLTCHLPLSTFRFPFLNSMSFVLCLATFPKVH
ncbi:hypothetical protein NPIL_44131 [Nephila pilipes]|uniref:Uncharacterized protein n=1 Tax=Nephila pilipes TaxID=299642 RepID=A0A8X6MHZ1_NEPPI|nr:hypothetical protein NPIL_44131 [Nephila pilipes]